MNISVAIVEDDKNYNEALKRLVNGQDDMYCCAQFFRGRQAEKGLVECRPDVILMDIQLGDMLGIEVMQSILPDIGTSRIIMCTTFEDEEKIFAALRAGASGYLVKGESLERILSSIREVYNDGAPMSQQIARKVIRHFSENHKVSLDLLSPAENEVLHHLAQGLKYREIADQKHVTVDTIKKQIKSIYRKLDVSNKVEAINTYNSLSQQ